MDSNSTKEYRARLTLDNNTVATVTSSDQRNLQATVQDLVLGQRSMTQAYRGKPVRFEQHPDGRSTFIFHESQQDGQQPLGWISEQDVPESMSVRAIQQQRREVQRAA